MYHKQKQVIVTKAPDPEGRRTLADVLKNFNLPSLTSVGRLDYMSQGLLLLTNNGELARYLENPKNGVERVYLVRIRGRLTEQSIKRIERGILVDGFKYAPIKVSIRRQLGPTRHWLEMTLKEGRNREIKRILNHLNTSVTLITRIRFGPYSLGSLPSGSIVEVPLKIHSFLFESD